MSFEQLGVSEVGQTFQAATIAKANQLADDLVGCALGYVACDQEFHERGGIKESLVELFFDPVGAEFGPIDNHGCQLQRRLDGVKGVEEGLLIFLQVAIVGQREPFDQHQ